MERCNKIINNSLYIKSLEEIGEFEKDRIYCLHDFSHSMDVARIAYIICLEENINIPKWIIYATALLHDIGRARQYEDNTPHHIASKEIADNILKMCEFSDDDTKLIVEAISEHRDSKHSTELGRVLQIADKKSRMCVNCKASKTCKWDREEMNSEITI